MELAALDKEKLCGFIETRVRKLGAEIAELQGKLFDSVEAEDQQKAGKMFSLLVTRTKEVEIMTIFATTWLQKTADNDIALAFATYGIGFIFDVGGKHFIVTRGKPGPRGLKFWYLLTPAVHIPERLRGQKRIPSGRRKRTAWKWLSRRSI